MPLLHESAYDLNALTSLENTQSFGIFRTSASALSVPPQSRRGGGQWGALQSPFSCGHQRQGQHSHGIRYYNCWYSCHLVFSRQKVLNRLDYLKKIKTANIYTPDTKHTYRVSMEDSIFVLNFWSRIWWKRKSRIKRVLQINKEVHDEIFHQAP